MYSFSGLTYQQTLPTNVGAVINDSGESFRRKKYPGRRNDIRAKAALIMLAENCWTLPRDVPYVK
jgi:hypothetical protein